jgi:urea-proton symporter
MAMCDHNGSVLIPCMLAAGLISPGISAIALENTPVFPTYPSRIPEADVTAGLVLPYAARGLLGTGGAVASFFLVFFAVTSAYSSELIAVSSIFTYDIFQTYIKPTAYGATLVRISHASCIGYALFMSSFGVGLYYAGIGMGYLYLMMGVIISAAVIPATLTLIWSDMNWQAAALSPVLGLACSLTAWLVTASRECGSLSVACTGSNYPMLAGNVTALLSPLIFVPILTFAFGRQKYDWQSMKNIARGDDSELVRRPSLRPGSIPEHQHYTEDSTEQQHLLGAAKIARWMTVGMTLVFLVLWPMPLYGSGYVFSKPFFTGWVVVGIIWLFGSTACVGVYPLWESRETIVHVGKAMWGDVTGKPVVKGVRDEERLATGQVTPEEEVVKKEKGAQGAEVGVPDEGRKEGV